MGTKPSLRLANSLSTQKVSSDRGSVARSESLVTPSRSAADSRIAKA